MVAQMARIAWGRPDLILGRRGSRREGEEAEDLTSVAALGRRSTRGKGPSVATAARAALCRSEKKKPARRLGGVSRGRCLPQERAVCARLDGPTRKVAAKQAVASG